MWVNKADNWSKDLTPLEKFMMERIIQRCDLNESISNKHKTSSGYTQVKELVSLCNLAITRSRTIRTVKVLIEESRHSLISQNICNDTIVDEYFSDLKAFILTYDSSKLTVDSNQPNLVELNALIHRLKIFESQLDRGYFHCLRKEFHKIDYSEKERIERNAARIARLVDILIPFLVFQGYAVSSLSEVLKTWVERKYKTTARRLFYFFNMRYRTYEYLIAVEPGTAHEYRDIIPLIEEDQNVEIVTGIVKELKKGKKELKLFGDDDEVILYVHSDLDPHIHFRTIYDRLLKRLIQKRERQSLTLFNNFLKRCYWRVPKPKKEYHFVELANDPINVNSRGRTLRDTLINCSDDFEYSFEEMTSVPIPKNDQISNALYYYNLALGSKSIENSLSLLWTSLESLLPFRSFFSDIECVQDFVSRALALGAVSRDIHGFGKRMAAVNDTNGNVFASIGCDTISKGFTKKGLIDWYRWIIDGNEQEKKFDLIKNQSQLMAFEYYRVGKPLVQGKLSHLYTRIKASHDSMQYQLQRIYLHRNQIIHSANLVNEYTNLWMHLEWYTGKLLAYSIIHFELIKSEKTLSDIFIEIHSDYEYVMSYFDKNKNVAIADISERIKRILLTYSWQGF